MIPDDVMPGTCPVCDDLLHEYEPYPSELSLKWLCEALNEHWRTGHTQSGSGEHFAKFCFTSGCPLYIYAG